jgi:cytochrome P450
MFNKLTDYLTEEYIFQSGFVRRKQLEHHNYCTERVDRRLAGVPKHHDLWSEILAKSEGLSLEEHHSTATFLMLAGTETTASALSGTTFLLLTNPDKLRTLTRELRAAFPGGRNDMILENLAREKYLTAVLQEGMRMYPPVPSELPRVVPAGGTTLFGEHIPGGTTIGVHHMTTYRREEFFRKPDEFHPERWLGDPEFKDDKLDAVENFSVGPRNCIGKVRDFFFLSEPVDQLIQAQKGPCVA